MKYFNRNINGNEVTEEYQILSVSNDDVALYGLFEIKNVLGTIYSKHG